MNVADVVSRVKRQFGDESGVQIVDADIINWINEAQVEIVSRNENLLQTVGTMNIVANQQDYAFPSDLLSLFSLSYMPLGFTSHVQIPQYSIQDFNELVNGWDGEAFGSGLTYCYTTYSQLIKLFPIPDSNVPNGLKLYYNRSPTVLVAPTGNLDLPLQYHKPILDYCLQQAHELDENLEASSLKEGQFERRVMANRHNDTKQAQEHYPTITVLAEDAY